MIFHIFIYKVIPLKLFLDIVPSSSEDATRAMREQPKRLSRDYLRRNGGKAIFCFGFVLWQRCFLHSQPSFRSAGFSFFSFLLCSFGCSFFGCLFGFRECSECNGVIILCSFICLCLQKITKRHSAYSTERKLYDG